MVTPMWTSVPQPAEQPEGPPLMHVPFVEFNPSTELAVIGEKREDPTQLLLLGEDGVYYVYSLDEGVPRPIEPDAGWDDEWAHDQDLLA